MTLSDEERRKLVGELSAVTGLRKQQLEHLSDEALEALAAAQAERREEQPEAAAAEQDDLLGKLQRKFHGPHKETPDWYERATKILGLVAGLGVFIYIGGAGVLAVRLHTAELPSSEVVSGLPRELLIGVGLQHVVAPAVALALVSGLEILFLKWWLRREENRGREQRRRRTAWTILIVGFLVTAVVAWMVLNFQRWQSPSPLRVGALGWLAAWLVAYVATLLIYVWHKGKREPLVVMALIALSVGLTAATVRVLYDRNKNHLKDATVCTNDGGPNYEGLFVGETSSAIYLGRVEEGLILAIPKDRVGEFRIGDMSSSRCSVPRPTQAPGLGSPNAGL